LRCIGVRLSYYSKASHNYTFIEMKIVQLFIFFISILLFSACTNSPQKKIIPETAILEKRVSQIFVEGFKSRLVEKNTVKYDIRITTKYTVEYDEKGRITKMIPDNPEDFKTFFAEYDEDTFSMRDMSGYQKTNYFYAPDKNTSDIEDIISGSLNENGYVQSSKHTDAFMKLYIGDMTYNDKGQLISLLSFDSGKISFKWKDDDIIRFKMLGKWTRIAYTSLENKNRFGFMLETGSPIDPYSMLLGKPSKYLPESMGKGEYRINYQYTMDEDGYVKEMAETSLYRGVTTRYSFVYE
jgi:hypothetical protein